MSSYKSGTPQVELASWKSYFSVAGMMVLDPLQMVLSHRFSLAPPVAL
jgi:hypothetical protein